MQPNTSLEAYYAQTPEKLAKDYAKIYLALKEIQPANYEEIAHKVGWEDINKVSRRLKEMYFKNMIMPNGKTTLTSRKKHSRQWVTIPQNVEI